MDSRKRFTMTQADYDAILEACRPVPAIALQCGMPASPQENANAAWARLGEAMGFHWQTVLPVHGSPLAFTAIPS